MKDPIILKVHIYLDETIDEPRSRAYCSIARRILESDPDICNTRWSKVDVRVNVPGKRDRIAFSRFSTGQRYYFDLPAPAKLFVDQLDGGGRPNEFTLVLHQSHLQRVEYSDVGMSWETGGTIDPGSQPNRASRTTRPIPA